ncbi:MAG: hypothetical protein ACPGTQ_06890 [Colwellia sp.]
MRVIVAINFITVFCVASCNVLAFDKGLANIESSNSAPLNTSSLSAQAEPSSSLANYASYSKTTQDSQLNGFFEFNYVSVEFNASYSDMLISNTAPVVNIQNNDKAYYLQSKISLPSSSHFNIAMTASFNQQDEKQNSFQQIPLTNSFFIIEKHQSAHYGLIGNYSFSSAWQVTGGVIHSLPVLESAEVEANNLAIIGTTYNF